MTVAVHSAILSLVVVAHLAGFGSVEPQRAGFDRFEGSFVRLDWLAELGGSMKSLSEGHPCQVVQSWLESVQMVLVSVHAARHFAAVLAGAL